MIHVCKRENNTKRNFLVLNDAQCKHFPNSPTKALEMFQKLANSLPSNYNDENVICVGFAETATAIGLEVARVKGYSYIHTTREPLHTKTFNFSEEHSHATNQTLAYVDFNDYDRVLFVEDEITTGKTILNIIDILNKEFPNLKFGVASILNGMTKEQMDIYLNRDISICYLQKIDNTDYSKLADAISVNGEKHVLNNGKKFQDEEMNITSNMDARKVIDTVDYTMNSTLACEDIVIYSNIMDLPKDGNICVIGTEEFMHPAIMLGSYLESKGYNVVSHSTTRSPIEVSNDTGYPLTSRWELPSVYDTDRITYIYNLKKYDQVIIVTEKNTCEDALVQALHNVGNNNILVVRVGD